jgi:hypothetical protein
MCRAFEQHQARILPTSQNPGGAINQQILQPVPEPIREPRINLLENFVGIFCQSDSTYILVTTSTVSNRSISSRLHWSSIIMVCTIIGEKLSSS